MRKASRDGPPPNLHWGPDVAVREPPGRRATNGRSGLIARALLRLREMARFFYALLTEP
jgi:hypothetical protein